MDRTMPIDLDNPRIGTQFRGYDRDQVDELLQGACRSLELILAENAALREQIERLRVDNDRYREDDGALKNALIAAQRSAEETRAMAQRSADLILEEARQSALAERVAAQQKVSELRYELEHLRREKEKFVAEFCSLLERTQREFADAVPTPAPTAAVISA